MASSFVGRHGLLEARGSTTAGRTTGVTSSAGTTNLAYDYESRVTSVNGPGVSDTFAYNGLDTRVGKDDSAGTSTYRRDGADVTAPVLGDGAAVYTPGVSQRRAGSTTYDLHDQLGTATKQTGSSTGVTATRTYDAFGMLVASTGTPQGPFGFAATSGYQEDGDSGLELLGHRYYDPSTGRFLTRDPVKDGRNWYVYCESDPLTSVDPTGYDPQDPKTPPTIPGPTPPKPTPPAPPDPKKPIPPIVSPPIDLAKYLTIKFEADISLKPPGVTVKPIFGFDPPGPFHSTLTFDDLNFKHPVLKLEYTILRF